MMVMDQSRTFGHFLLTEMKKRGMSARELADLVGVTHTVINKFLNHGISDTYAGRPVGDPSIEFLTKLSVAINVDICQLIALVAPNAFKIDPRPEDTLRSQQIGQLDPGTVKSIDAMIVGATLNAVKDPK